MFIKLTQNNSRYNTKHTMREIFFPSKGKIKTIRRKAVIAKDTFDKNAVTKKLQRTHKTQL